MPNIHDFEVDEYLYQSVHIDDMLLDGEFKRVASDLAYWNARYAAAVTTALDAKFDVKRIRARAWEAVRNKIQESGERATEKVVEARVDLDEDVAEAERAYSAAEGEKLRLRGFAEAVATKKDALQSLGAKLRREMDGDARVVRAHADARRMERGEDDF